jgi:hypothetical protein
MADDRETTRPLSGQQISELQKRYESAVRNAIMTLELRKYSMQTAIDVLKAGGIKSSEAIVFANSIYEFLVVLAADAKVTTD